MAIREITTEEEEKDAVDFLISSLSLSLVAFPCRAMPV